MRKIYVLHENNEWTIHLQQRLEELKLPFELWHLDKGLIDLSDEPPEGVFYNRISASSHTRNHRYAPEFTSAVIDWLERHDRTVINGSQALKLELSKVSQYMALSKHGIMTPKTIAVSGKEQVIAAAKELGEKSFITKHNRAGKGLGVQLFHSTDALEQYLRSDDYDQPVDGIWLIQQYIKSPKPFITRHEFIDGKFFYAVKVDTSEGFELCPADACVVDELFCPANGEVESDKFEIVTEYNNELVSKFETLLASNNIQVAGIETISDGQGDVYTYDINTNTNYNSDAEQKAGKFAMLELARYLGRLL
jgi:hypothetical protein